MCGNVKSDEKISVKPWIAIFCHFPSWNRYVDTILFVVSFSMSHIENLSYQILKSAILWYENVKCTIYFPWERELGTPIVPLEDSLITISSAIYIHVYKFLTLHGRLSFQILRCIILCDGIYVHAVVLYWMVVYFIDDKKGSVWWGFFPACCGRYYRGDSLWFSQWHPGRCNNSLGFSMYTVLSVRNYLIMKINQ